MSKQEFDDLYQQFLNEVDMKQGKLYFELDELTFLKYHKHRFKTILLSIPNFHNPLKVLDIGTTPFTIFIKKYYPHWEVSTIDLTDSLRWRCVNANITFKNCDLVKDKIAFDDSYFDVVILAEVIEHLPIHPSSVLKDVWRILKNNGHLIFGTANYASLAKRIKLLLGLNPQMPVDRVFPEDCMQSGYGHLREYTLSECIRFLRSNGFTIKEAKFVSYWNKWEVHLIESGQQMLSRFLLIFTPVYDIICKIAPPYEVPFTL